MKKIGQWLSEGSGWVIESVDTHHLNLVEYIPIKGGFYIKLPPKLQNLAKGLINLKNDDECFRHYTVLNHMLTVITKFNKISCDLSKVDRDSEVLLCHASHKNEKDLSPTQHKQS